MLFSQTWIFENTAAASRFTENPMCWRIEAGVLYAEYQKHCQRHYHSPFGQKGFIDVVLSVHPSVKLSDWRWDGKRDFKEFDGLRWLKDL